MKLCEGRLLSNDQLKYLRQHQYSCQGRTILEKLFLLSYWDWLTLKIPLWLAPNVLTIWGLIINVATTLILVWYSPDAKQEPPRWACGLCALGIFAYQSLDGVDGKQARRTGTANPLGELFDHGCDSISVVFLGVAICISFQAGLYPEMLFLVCFAGMALFYCAHWQKYISGTLHFGNVDVIEVEFLAIGVVSMSAFFGPDIWSTKMAGLEMEIRGLIFITIGITAFFLISTHLSFVVTTAMKKRLIFPDPRVLQPAVPFVIAIASAFICKKSKEHVYEEHPCLYIFTFGLVTAKVTNSIMVAHMTKSEIKYIDSSFLAAAIFVLNQYFGPLLKEYYLLWFCLVWVVIDLVQYCWRICLEISGYLGVEVFTMPHLGKSRAINKETNVIDEH